MSTNKTRTKAAVTLIVTLFLLFFFFGGLFVLFGRFNVNMYAILCTIIGGLASIIGLISLSRPNLQQSDLEQIESATLMSIAQSTETIKSLENEKTKALKTLEHTKVITEEQIQTLKLQKEQMEYLVQKASLSLFLKERRSLYEKQITGEVSKNIELKNCLIELSQIDQKLIALNQEIEKDANVELLKSVIESAKAPINENLFSGRSLLEQVFLQIARSISMLR